MASLDEMIKKYTGKSLHFMQLFLHHILSDGNFIG